MGIVKSAIGKGIHVRDTLIRDMWQQYVKEGGKMPLEEFSRLFTAFTYGMGKAGFGAVAETAKKFT